ncbi:MAG: hypothetical protein JNJ57_13965, partial [Saprospiraceae bacterium]|nr:hypothetical protein [Saprospiraceae bacterium]
MTRTNYLFILPMLWASVAFSQSDVDFCAQEYFLNLTQADGASNHQLEAYEQDIFQFFNFRHQKSNNTESGSFAVRTLPVVVHIVHENGVENLSDAQVQQGINWLNEALANSGAFFQGTGADTEIRLCLAQRTPDNQPTNGITHTFSPLTNLEYNQEDAQLKNLIRWNPKDYINIWVVKEICHSNGNCSVAGYTTQWTDHGAADDGIVVEARNFGIDINGTALWVHELGHYFSLYHTFYYGCTNQDCLLQGDKICDTPPDQSTAGAPCDQSVNSCSTDTDSGPFTTDQPDMTWNFMDYGNFSCMHDFTADQTVRMNFCLDGKRNPLLKSKGCSLPCLNPVTAAFSYNPLQVQPGQQVQFTNESQGAASYVWRINGQVFSSQTSPSYTFNTGGVFVVTLTALPLDTTICPVATYQTTFEVICPAQAYFQLDDLSISPGEWVYIQATTSPGSVSWLVDGVHIGASLDSLQLFALGAHTITLQVDNGICTSEYSQTVQVSCEFQAYFELDDYEVLVGEWVYIENLDTGPGAISWFLDDSPLGSNLDSLQLLETGEHKITVRVSSGSCTQEYSRYVLVRAECEFKTWQELINLPDALTGNFLSPVTKMVPLADNNFLLIAADMIQIYLLKVDTAGQLIWSNKIPSVIQNGAYIEFDALGTDDGGFLIVHQSPNNNGLVFGHKLLKFNTNGDFLWSKIFEGPAGKFVAIN